MKLARLSAATLLLCTLIFSGCQTPRVDWNARVGQYTMDQVVLEMGPPDKSAKLTDGTLVAEWVMYRGSSHGFVIGDRYWGIQHHYSHSSSDYFLRLTFAPDGKLKEFKRYWK